MRRREKRINELGARNAAFSNHFEEKGLCFWNVPGSDEVVNGGRGMSGVVVTLMKDER